VLPLIETFRKAAYKFIELGTETRFWASAPSPLIFSASAPNARGLVRLWVTEGEHCAASPTPDGVVNLLISLYRLYPVWHTRSMKTAMPVNSYKNHCFPAEIISHAVWLYFRFCLSYRDVEELLFARGIIVTYEAIRKWCRKFGQSYANELRRRRLRPGDKWHLDEVFLTIKGERYYLWRAVDQDGCVLDILVRRRRNKQACLSPIN
jgi:DDE domain